MKVPTPQVVVLKDVLDLDDPILDTPSLGRRPRAVSDLTDTKLPLKVKLHGHDGAELRPHLAPGRVGLGSDTVPRPGSASLAPVTDDEVPFRVPEHSTVGGVGGLPSPVSVGAPTCLPFPEVGQRWSNHGAGIFAGAIGYNSISPVSLPSKQGVYYPGALLGAVAADTAGLGLKVQSQFAQPTPHSPQAGSISVQQLAALAQQLQRLEMWTDPQAMAGAMAAGRGVDLSAPPPRNVPAATSPAAPPRFQEEAPAGDPTTVMLRNIPNRYTQGMLLTLLESRGYSGLYDFVYLPMDFRNGVNLGYAFVNVLGHPDAMRFMNAFEGFSEWLVDSVKVCETSWAHPHQGLTEHVERYRNSPVMHPRMPDEYKPMVFFKGVRVPFPPPTKAIKAPKLRLTKDRATAGTGGDVTNLVSVCA